jgi:hypothetical protein
LTLSAIRSYHVPECPGESRFFCSPRRVRLFLCSSHPAPDGPDAQGRGPGPGRRPAPVPGATNTSTEIAARINNEIITWKDVRGRSSRRSSRRPDDRAQEVRSCATWRRSGCSSRPAKKHNLSVSRAGARRGAAPGPQDATAARTIRAVIRIRSGTKNRVPRGQAAADPDLQALPPPAPAVLDQSGQGHRRADAGLRRARKIREYFNQHPSSSRRSSGSRSCASGCSTPASGMSR